MNAPDRRGGYPLSEIFRVPLWIGVASLVGLVGALVGDGWLDALSWLALGLPLWMIVRALRSAKRTTVD